MTTHRTMRLYILATVACVLAFVAFAATHAAWSMYEKFSEASTASASAKLELSVLQARETKVSAALVAVSSDRGVESQVRERFGVARPGEGEIHVVRNATTDTSVESAPNDNAESESRNLSSA